MTIRCDIEKKNGIWTEMLVCHVIPCTAKQVLEKCLRDHIQNKQGRPTLIPATTKHVVSSSTTPKTAKSSTTPKTAHDSFNEKNKKIDGIFRQGQNSTIRCGSHDGQKCKMKISASQVAMET